jgi:hypothetical protein
MDQTTPSLQEIQDKIRAAATAAGINPDTALRIANAESVFSNTAKNTRSSARGLFQVIDQTWKDLGGDPKLRNDLDENIRIGIKAISNNRDAFLKKYGVEPDTKQLYGMHFLGPSQAIRVFNSADDAAIKNIVPKKVIKANPFLDKMSVADFISFTQKKMDKKSPVAPSPTAIAKTETAPVPMPQAPRETMQQTPTKAPVTKEVASAPMNRNMLAELGANYQAALGAIALADSAEDEEADELLMEKYAERFGDQTVDVPITSALSNVQLTYASPFEEPAPVQMATGGEVGVQKMAFGGLPYKPSALIPSAVKNQVGQAQADLDAYNQQVSSYNAQLENYKKQVEDYNNQFSNYEDLHNKYKSSYIAYNDEPVPFFNTRGMYTYNKDLTKYTGPTIKVGTPNLAVKQVGKMPETGVPIYYLRQGEYRNLEAPTAPRAPGSEPTAPAQPNVGAAQAALAAAKDKQRRLQLTYDVMEDPERFNLSMPALFAEGGVAEGVPVQNKIIDRANQPITTPDGYEITPSFADRMGANVSDFVVNVGTKAASLFPVDETKMSAAHRLYLDTFGIKENRAPVTKDYFNQEEMAALTDLVTRKGGKKGSISYNDYKTLMGDRPVKSYPLTSGRLDPYVSISKSLGQFNYEYDPKTGSYKILDQYDFNPKPIKGGISSDSNFIGDYIGEDQASLMDKLRIYAGRKLPPGTGRQVDLSVPAPRKRAEGSPIYGEIPDSGPITADTRAAMSNFQVPNAREAMAALKKIYGEGLSNAESLVRGSLAAVPGTFGDIGQEFDIRGLRNLPTTEQLLKKYPQRMTQPTAETAKFEEVGQYMPPPIPPAAVSGTAKAMMKGLKESGPQVESVMRKIAPAAEPFSILRPTGGEFATVKSMSEAPISRFDSTLAKLFESRAEPQYASVNKFFDTKFRDYFKKQAGSVSDPVREGLISGKIKIPKDSPLEEMFPEALIKAARDGDITAMKLIEKQLDEGIQIKSYKKSDVREYDSDILASDEMRSSILQQMKRNPDIIPDAMLLRLAKKNASNLSPEKAAQTVADIRAKLKANPELFSTVYEEKIMRMMPERLTEVVTPEYMEKYPSLYGNVKNIFDSRQGIMALKGAAPVLDVESPPRLFGMTLNRMHELMQRLPEKELERMDVPTVLNKVIQLDKVSNEVAGYANRAEKLISAGKVVPEKLTTYGTKPFTTADEQGFMWREITEPDAATIQGKLLGNSIGGYARPGSYGSLSKGRTAIDNGEVRLFGLYDKNNQLMTNVEYVTNKAETLKNSIPQFYGNGPATGNVSPDNFVPQVVELINKLNPDNIPPSIKQLLRDSGISITK